MKKPRKKKNGFLRLIKVVVFVVLICGGAVGALLYNRLFFKGEVKDKYQAETNFQTLIVKNNHILVKTWFGEKDFCVDDETFEKIEVGEDYFFKKNTVIDWVQLRDKKTEEKKESEEN